MRADEGDWQAFLDGVEKKILLHDAAPGTETYLLRMAPGSRLPAHPHKVTEECLVLEGEVWVGEVHFSAGDFHVATAADVHPEVVAPSGALLYLRGEIHAPAV